jgi:hypothetical protein
VLLAQAHIRVAHLGKRDAGFLVAQYGKRRLARRCASFIETIRCSRRISFTWQLRRVTNNHAQVCSGLPRANLLECAQQAFLKQIFGTIGLAAEVSSVPP